MGRGNEKICMRPEWCASSKQRRKVIERLDSCRRLRCIRESKRGSKVYGIRARCPLNNHSAS